MPGQPQPRPSQVVPEASEEELLQRLDESTSRVLELEPLVSPLQESSNNLSTEVLNILGAIRGGVAGTSLIIDVDIDMVRELRGLLDPLCEDGWQLGTGIMSVATLKALNTEAADRMFPVYQPPHDITDRNSWIKARPKVRTKRWLRPLGEAVLWWEQEQAKLTQLVDSLRANFDHLERDRAALLGLVEGMRYWFSHSYRLTIDQHKAGIWLCRDSISRIEVKE